MSNSAKNLTRLDGNQVLQSSYNPEDTTISVNGFIVGAVGRKVEISTLGAVETYTFSENGNTLYVLELTYTDATKSVLVSAERIA
jgi:hypothetical protein